MRWLYVDFNSYFASVEQQRRPELRGKPIAVVAIETDDTSAIAASYEAKAFGIKTGTRIQEAKRLCPGLACVLARHECYAEFHHRLIEEIGRPSWKILRGSMPKRAFTARRTIRLSLIS
jgi:DNA polymerase IV